jgi:hypothetical protein
MRNWKSSGRRERRGKLPASKKRPVVSAQRGTPPAVERVMGVGGQIRPISQKKSSRNAPSPRGQRRAFHA